jgi:hypothetical protein
MTLEALDPAILGAFRAFRAFCRLVVVVVVVVVVAGGFASSRA